MYANKLAACGTSNVKYVLEHVIDYYPYGKTLREHVLERERFQATFHERDEETGSGRNNGPSSDDFRFDCYNRDNARRAGQIC